jgi:hypothetical protein
LSLDLLINPEDRGSMLLQNASFSRIAKRFNRERHLRDQSVHFLRLKRIFEEQDGIDVAQDRDQWRALIHWLSNETVWIEHIYVVSASRITNACGGAAGGKGILYFCEYGNESWNPIKATLILRQLSEYQRLRNYSVVLRQTIVSVRRRPRNFFTGTVAAFLSPKFRGRTPVTHVVQPELHGVAQSVGTPAILRASELSNRGSISAWDILLFSQGQPCPTGTF